MGDYFRNFRVISYEGQTEDTSISMAKKRICELHASKKISKINCCMIWLPCQRRGKPKEPARGTSSGAYNEPGMHFSKEVRSYQLAKALQLVSVCLTVSSVFPKNRLFNIFQNLWIIILHICLANNMSKYIWSIQSVSGTVPSSFHVFIHAIFPQSSKRDPVITNLII